MTKNKLCAQFQETKTYPEFHAHINQQGAWLAWRRG